MGAVPPDKVAALLRRLAPNKLPAPDVRRPQIVQFETLGDAVIGRMRERGVETTSHWP